MSKRIRTNAKSSFEQEINRMGWVQVEDMGDSFLYKRDAKSLVTKRDRKTGEMKKSLVPNPKSWFGFRQGRQDDPERGTEYMLVTKPTYEKAN